MKINSYHIISIILLFIIYAISLFYLKTINNQYKIFILYLLAITLFYIITKLNLAILSNFKIKILLIILSNLLFMAQNFLIINYYFDLKNLIIMAMSKIIFMVLLWQAMWGLINHQIINQQLMVMYFQKAQQFMVMFIKAKYYQIIHPLQQQVLQYFKINHLLQEQVIKVMYYQR